MAPGVKPVRHGFWIWLAALALVGAVLSNCQPLSEPGPEETSRTGFVGDPETLLPGTWLREYSAKGVASRHILTLRPDHHFRETVRVSEHENSEIYVHEGTWLFDGTNLKRKYTSMNGRPPSRLNLPYVTFEITFDSPREFRGVDHIHRNDIDYRRVADGTQP